MTARDYLLYGMPVSTRHAIVLYVHAFLHVWEHGQSRLTITFAPPMLWRSWDRMPEAGEGSHIKMHTVTMDNIYTG